MQHSRQGNAFCGQVPDLDRQRHCGTWFPHALLEDLLAQLAATAAKSPDLAELHGQLADALRGHYDAAAEQSRILEQRMMTS
jgi:hypothetical protein